MFVYKDGSAGLYCIPKDAAMMGAQEQRREIGGDLAKALAGYSQALDNGIFKPGKEMPGHDVFFGALNKARLTAISGLKKLGISREETEILLKQEFETKKGIVFTLDEENSIILAVHNVYTSVAAMMGQEFYHERASVCGTVTGW